MSDDLRPGERPGEPLRADLRLGAALREALAMPHDGAFVTRLGALVRQRGERTWDEVLAGWFWQGVLAMSLVAMAAALGSLGPAGNATSSLGEESIAVQLLDSDRPGAEVILASMSGPR
jgi:hypothetical protein